MGMKNYELEIQKALAEVDRLAIEKVKELKEDVLFVRDTFRKYGITMDKCRPKVPLSSLIYPLTVPEEERIHFEKAEERITASVRNCKPPILESAMIANIHMLYWDPVATFENIGETVTPYIK